MQFWTDQLNLTTEASKLYSSSFSAAIFVRFSCFALTKFLIIIFQPFTRTDPTGKRCEGLRPRGSHLSGRASFKTKWKTHYLNRKKTQNARISLIEKRDTA